MRVLRGKRILTVPDRSRLAPEPTDHELEKQVKKDIIKILEDRGIYYFMPVQTGWGKRSLDFLACPGGWWLAIETKASGKRPTAKQRDTAHDMFASGAIAVWCDDANKILPIIKFCLDHPVDPPYALLQRINGGAL